MSHHYPIFLDLTHRPVLVVGGGLVALRKTKALLRAGARVRVVAPDFCTGFSRLPAAELVCRRFRSSDLARAWLVVAATSEPVTNQKIFTAASRQKIWVNVVDQPELCTFAVPAVVRRGSLQVAVSTGGAAPLLARQLRQILAQHLPELGDLATALGRLRAQVRAHLPTPAARKKFWQKILAQLIKPR